MQSYTVDQQKFGGNHCSNNILELRKFGPAFCDLPTMLQNVAKLLRVLTLNIDNKHKSIPISFYILTMVTASAYLYVFVASISWFLVTRCVPTHDVIRAVILFSLCVSSEIGNAKYLVIYTTGRALVREILKTILDFDATTIPESRFSKNVLKSMRQAKLRALIYWFMIMGNGLIYISKPLLTPGRHFMDDVFTIYGLEPMEKSPNYEMGYVLMIASVWFLCYVPASVTAFLIIIAGYIEAQILALSQEMVQIWPDAVQHCHFSSHQNNRQQVLNKLIRLKLQNVIRKHAMNIYLLQMLEKVFRSAIALEFMLLIVGLIAELLGGLKNTYLEIPYAFLQVAMDCWTGQRVMDANAKFEAATYACQWERFDVSNMKIVLVILTSAQKTLKLSAGGVTVLSFASLMSVVKSIYSAYATLASTIK